ncbi:MAG: hypothetical protein LBH34_02965 [Prevotellaceae bacterium]|jgi:hypothetical protein|nr:hypothetical protein [Prevotellaceae bacterium]
MKKKIFSMLAVIAVVALAFTSCSKDDPAEPVKPDEGKEATFIGKVLIQTNESTLSAAPKVWSAPVSLDIVARVRYNDLGIGGGSTYYNIPANKISYNNSTGEYIIKAPVNSQGSQTSIEVAIGSFTGKVTKTKPANGGVVDVEVDVVWAAINYFTTPSGTIGATVYIPTRQLSSSSCYEEVVSVGEEI